MSNVFECKLAVLASTLRLTGMFKSIISMKTMAPDFQRGSKSFSRMYGQKATKLGFYYASRVLLLNKVHIFFGNTCITQFARLCSLLYEKKKFELTLRDARKPIA